MGARRQGQRSGLRADERRGLSRTTSGLSTAAVRPARRIEALDQDTTSYFRATAVFPGGWFIELRAGEQSLDLNGDTTLAAGLRFGQGSI